MSQWKYGFGRNIKVKVINFKKLIDTWMDVLAS